MLALNIIINFLEIKRRWPFSSVEILSKITLLIRITESQHDYSIRGSPFVHLKKKNGSQNRDKKAFRENDNNRT